MKITDLKWTPVFVPIEAPLRYSQGAHPGFSRIIVQLETDEGITGLGECYGGKAREGQLGEFRASLRGEDPFQLERIRWKLGSPGALKLFGHVLPLAAVEFACLDIQGKALGRPISDLLGGRIRDRIPFCAYLFYRYPNEKGEGEVSNAAQMVEFARALTAQYGFQTMKYKCGVLPPDEEIATVIALREAFPHHKIRMDPNAVWSVSTALYVAKKLRDSDLEYLEDPTWGLRGMARVNQKAPWVTLASNMSVFSIEDLPPAALLEVLDVVLLDPHWYGGITRARLAGQICEVFNLDIGMHSGAELGVSLAAMLHLGAVLPNLAVALDSHYHHLCDDVIQGGKLKYENGAIAVPAGPGLGVKLDPDKVAKYHELAKTQAMGSWIEDPRSPGAITCYPKF
ncbi:MAG: enolase C-terminal domain-like protein [Terriglobia bacterium]